MLSSLTLLNFRNHLQKSFAFNQKVNLFLGANASGKTNILEAICLLATGKSFKTNSSPEMINFDSDFSRVSGDLEEDSLEVLLTRGIYQGKRVALKKYLVNGVPKSLKNFTHKFYVVTFQPEDIQLVTGSPSLRRHLLDFTLSQIDWQYSACLSAYQKALRQRNRLLSQIRDGQAQYFQLEYWNRLLVKNGQIIQKYRQEFIEFIDQFASSSVASNLYSDDIVKSLSYFAYIYQPNIIDSDRLEKHRVAEIATGNTLIGPHRDDFQFLFNLGNDKKALSSFASRGQQRLGVLALKLAQLAFMESKVQTSPILLLDDIFSELDSDNDLLVLDIIAQHSSFITTTDLDLVSNKLKEVEIFKIK